MKTRVVSALMAVAVATLTANAVTVGKEGKIASAKQLRAIVVNTAVVELPAKAAKIVSESPEDVREKAAIRVVRTFLQGRHSLAPSLVGAIAKASPEVAPAIVAEAVMLFPESAYSIARAATSAAPNQSVAIALRAAAASPTESTIQKVALGAASADQRVPQVLAALSSELAKYSVDEALKITISFGRIGNSSSSTGSTPVQPLPGAKVEVKVTVGQDAQGNPVTITETVTVQDDTVTITIPDDLTGVEQKGQIDIIARVLDTTNEFTGKVTEAPVVYVN